MDTLGSLIGKQFNPKSTLVRQATAGLVVQRADALIKQTWGKKMQDQVMVTSLVRGTLKIKCADPITAQEIKFKQNMIIDELNTQFKSEVVKKLRILQSGLEKDLF